MNTCAAPEAYADTMAATLLAGIDHDGSAKLARAVNGRSLYPLLSGAPEDAGATAWGEYLAEGAIAPMYMLRRGPWKFIHTPADPDQLFNLTDDPHELNKLAVKHPLADIHRMTGLWILRFS